MLMEHYECYLEIRERDLGSDRPRLVQEFEKLVALYSKTGRDEEAIALEERAEAPRR